MSKRANPNADSAARIAPTKAPRTVHTSKIIEALSEDKPSTWQKFTTSVKGNGMTNKQRSMAWKIFKGNNYTAEAFDSFRDEIESTDTKDNMNVDAAPKEAEDEKAKEEEETEEMFTGDAVFEAISEMYKKYVDEAADRNNLQTSGQFEQAMDEGITKAREDALKDGRVFNGKDEEIEFALDWLNKTFADKAPKQEPAPAQAPEQAGQAEKPASVPNHGRFDKRVPAKDKVTEKIGEQPRERQDARAKAVKKQKQAQFIANRLKVDSNQAPADGGPAGGGAAGGGAADGVPADPNPADGAQAANAQAANAPVVGGPQVVEGQPLPPVEYTEPVTDSYVTEGLSRDGPMTAQHAVEMDKEDGEGKSTDRLKDEIKAMHLVYNHKVKEFLDKNHQSAMHRALLSHDADTVRGHHRGMLEAVAKYYASGKGNGMRIGVVVSAEQYMAKFGGGGGGGAAAGGGGGGANPHHVQQVHSYRKGENPFSQAVDMQSFYQRGGMSSYKQHAVYGHKLPPPNETRPFQVHDPLARVDMPLQHALQRPITQVGFGAQYKLKSSKELMAVYD